MKVLIPDKFSPILVNRLKEKGVEHDYLPKISTSELQKLLNKNEYTILAFRSKIDVNASTFEQNSSIKFIIRGGSGLDHVDLDFCKKRGIRVFSTPQGNSNAVGEHALGMLLALQHKLVQSNFEVKHWKWDRKANTGDELFGKTVGIIGYGNTGPAFAEKLRGFSVRILVYDKYRTGFSNKFVDEVSLEEIFENADIFSVHLPLTSETNEMIDADFLSRFKKSIVIINTSRGEIIKTQDLIPHLDSGKLKASALDVLENENFENLTEMQKTTFAQLFKYENVILSPHVAGLSEQSADNIAALLVDRILSCL